MLDYPGTDPKGWIKPEPGDLVPRPWVYRDPRTIPPRRWLVGTTLLRGYATILGSPGGVGKTALAVALCLAYITGKDILGQHVFKTGKAWYHTLEDDRDELDRRIAAAMIAHGIPPEEIEGRLFVNSAGERSILLAKTDERGKFSICADAEALEVGIREQEIGLTCIDPLVKAHRVEENSNGDMDALISIMNGIAGRTDSSILVPCHFRKGGATEDGARDSFRGGGALVDGARISRSLVPMSPKEAEAFGVPPAEAHRYIRIIDPKGNMTPKNQAVWVELTSIPIGNCFDQIYPNGDNVQAVRAWAPPSAFEAVSYNVIEAAFARIRSGPAPGEFYSPVRQSKDWVGKLLIELAGTAAEQADGVIQIWTKNGVLLEDEYYSPKRRKNVARVTLSERQAREILASREGASAYAD